MVALSSGLSLGLNVEQSGAMLTTLENMSSKNLRLLMCTLYLIGIYKDSIKGLTRHYRDIGASRVYQLTLDTELPSMDVLLKVTENKEQLIQLVVDDFIRHASSIYPNKVILTGQDPIPIQISNGNVTSAKDLRATQEEADTIIIHQLVVSAPSTAIIIADDTEIFVLLLHFIHTANIKSKLYLQPTNRESSTHSIDIDATYEKYL